MCYKSTVTAPAEKAGTWVLQGTGGEQTWWAQNRDGAAVPSSVCASSGKQAQPQTGVWFWVEHMLVFSLCFTVENVSGNTESFYSFSPGRLQTGSMFTWGISRKLH